MTYSLDSCNLLSRIISEKRKNFPQEKFIKANRLCDICLHKNIFTGSLIEKIVLGKLSKIWSSGRMYHMVVELLRI